METGLLLFGLFAVLKNVENTNNNPFFAAATLGQYGTCVGPWLVAYISLQCVVFFVLFSECITPRIQLSVIYISVG